MFTKRNLTILAMALFSILLGYRFAPFHFAELDPDIEDLIEQLASANSPPEFPGRPPHFFLREFLENPGQWDPEAQRKVSEAYYELESMGKKAIPYLINHFEDERYSHECCYSTFVSRTVGDACKSIVDGHIDLRGMSYKSRESPSGTIMGEEVMLENYVKWNYGSYSAWWRNNQSLSLSSIRLNYCRWRIDKEKQFGFVDDDQKNQMTESFRQMLKDAETPSAKKPLPLPADYTIDELVREIKALRN